MCTPPWPSLFDRPVDEGSRTRQSPTTYTTTPMQMATARKKEEPPRPCYMAAGPFDIRNGTLRRGVAMAGQLAFFFYLFLFHGICHIAVRTVNTPQANR